MGTRFFLWSLYHALPSSSGPHAFPGLHFNIAAWTSCSVISPSRSSRFTACHDCASLPT
ncbi:hypothetical protein PR003_g12104 [Phytophthora rubi]|uniref:Uncharacterized protein n=1 Tax=Phytophthora rubi TaxID=129364 RepID=A0A6A4F9C0_9STRA|nr:hypothetical protein PR003_g12104 [Phytophthora rubi]